ncbi:MAG: DUF3604 domain-containing protein, partial [Firmicutes bacterium]|nr:DUF3604 domain-containing protein [Bacillota bacterium]
ATGKPELLKNINVGLILDIIKGQGPISRAEIARVSGISPPTVSHLVNRLAQEGVVEEIGFGTSIGGRRGSRLGFIASSDGHDGHPGGAEAWTGLALRPKPYGSGLVAVYAEELTREAVFEALRRRRVYAVTGARIQLGFWVAGHFMGEETHMKAGVRPEIRISVEGIFPLELIEVVRDGHVIGRWGWGEKRAEILHVDETPPPGLHFYYLRVRQGDGEMAWSSPVWVVVS